MTGASEVMTLEGGRILDPGTGRDEVGDLFVVDGLLADHLPPRRHAVRIDVRGCWVLPGLLDLHAHFREPGGEASETLATGARAAARGGFTRVVTMPNTQPPVDTPEAVRWIRTPAEPWVEILPSACCTQGRQGRVPANFEGLRDAGAVAFTDDGSMVAEDAVMERVLRAVGALNGLVMDHAVLPERAAGGVIRDCALARRCGLPVFPASAEVEAVKRDVRLCRETGCRLHVQHLSCAASVEVLRSARHEGVRVSAEATPHHLLLAADEIPGDDADWKMNPPLGQRDDVAALRAAMVEGVIACCATDHAPHERRLKEGGFRAAAFGVLGLETAVGATLTALVQEMGWSPLGWAGSWTTAPAKVLGLAPPVLSSGARADLCILRPEDWTVGPEDLVSRSRNSPFVGRRLHGRVVATLRAGRFTWRDATWATCP